MATQSEVNLSLEYENTDGETISLSLDEITYSHVNSVFNNNKQTFDSSNAEIITLNADITTLGAILLINQDETNSINIYTSNPGVAGVIFAKLWPKGSTNGPNFCFLYVGSDVTVPYGKATGGTPTMRKIILPSAS